MTKAIIYPGTFDPITNGHVDLVTRAAQLFDRVVVAVASNEAKKPTLEIQQRLNLTQMALSHLNNIDVIKFDGLLVDTAQHLGIFMVLRGLRAVSDFEFEFQLATMNRRLMPQLETFFLTPSEEHAYVSSSLIREIAKLGGDVSQFVPPNVAKALRALA